jgi:hypothetical protein
MIDPLDGMCWEILVMSLSILGYLPGSEQALNSLEPGVGFTPTYAALQTAA